MSNGIDITSTVDADGCLIVTATRGETACTYDGDQYTGGGDSDDALREAVRAAYVRIFAAQDQ